MLPPMRRSPLLRLHALLAAALLWATATGLPSHSHDAGEAAGIESPDRHGHGVQLVEQGPRVIAGMPVFAPSRAPAVDWAAPVAHTALPSPAEGRPHDRAPPSSRPRAPPPHV